MYKACAVSLYTILVRKIGGHFVTLFFNMSQNDLKLPNRILLIFSAIHIKSFAFRFATPTKGDKRFNIFLVYRNVDFYLIHSYLYLLILKLTTFHIPNAICCPFNKISPRFTVIEIKTAQSKRIGYKVGYMARFVCCNTNRQSVFSEHSAKDTYPTAFLVAYRIA